MAKSGNDRKAGEGIRLKFKEVGVVIPKTVDPVLFEQGYNHRMDGGNLTDPKKHFKASFREGFRAACLLQQEEERRAGIPPVKAQMTTRSKPDIEP